MRYRIICVDGTSKIVTEDEGKQAQAAKLRGQAFMVHGSVYSPSYVSAIKSMKDWFDEEQEQARRDGKRLCKYGNVHPPQDRCSCHDAGFPALPSDETGRLSLPEPMRPSLEPPPAPPTPEERRKIEAWQKMRKGFIEGHSMPALTQGTADPQCAECHGTGTITLLNTTVSCNCVLRWQKQEGVQ